MRKWLVFQDKWVMAAKRLDQKEVRVILPQEVYSLLRRIAGVRETSLNKLMNEAVEDWLAAETQQETIDRHRLDEIDED
jgi:predicted transcriptional regulator